MMRTQIIPNNQNLQIQTWLDSDASELFRLVDINREILQQWLIWVPKTKTQTDIINFIHKCQDEYQKQTGLQMGLWENHQLIGTIGLNNLDHASHKASIGYWLSQDHQGKGIMTQAVKALINYGFSKLELNRIELKIARLNAKSRSVATRIGFVEEGTLRQDEFLNQKYHDYVVYSHLRDEWAPDFPTPNASQSN